jgi:cytochrome P450
MLTAVHATDDLGLELLSPGFSADPYPVFRRMREVAPVLRSPALQRWVLTGYEACRQALRSRTSGWAATST